MANPGTERRRIETQPVARECRLYHDFRHSGCLAEEHTVRTEAMARVRRPTTRHRIGQEVGGCYHSGLLSVACCVVNDTTKTPWSVILSVKSRRKSRRVPRGLGGELAVVGWIDALDPGTIGMSS